MTDTAINVLLAARRVAILAELEGALVAPMPSRPVVDHMGALLADAVLQSGLNYATVVKPRVFAILERYPDADRVSALVDLINQECVSTFLRWKHAAKIVRFEELVELLLRSSVETANDLRSRMVCQEFRSALLAIHGIGPKTVDYLACLIGLESIPVDRHVRTYALRAGVLVDDYHFLREVFCSAADLLSLSRRAFDGWVWSRESSAFSQSDFAF